MELVILMGLPASGKSSFYKEKFADTHVRINQDMLKTKQRVDQLFDFCLTQQIKCVIDNTNILAKLRSAYVEKASSVRYNVVGYFFKSTIPGCLERNRARSDANRVPDVAIISKSKELELPKWREGYDELFFVSLKDQGFDISPWHSSE